MRPLFGPRTVVEAAIIVAVPVVALEIGFHLLGIVLAGAIAYVLVVFVELGYWYEARRRSVPEVSAAAESRVPDTQHVRVLRAEPEPEPVAIAVVEAAPETESITARPQLAPAPSPPPAAPEPDPAPEPAPPPAATVIRIGDPRQWNLRDLERVAREDAGGDPIADEERTFLLHYLRDFAGPDGMLPVDFDDLVRQSFGGLVANL
jgi:hypothetical protein